MKYSMSVDVAASQSPPQDIIDAVRKHGTFTTWDWQVGDPQKMERESTVNFSVEGNSLVDTVNVVRALLSEAGGRIVGYSVY